MRELRSRYEAEWLSHLSEEDGFLRRLSVATGFIRAALHIRFEVNSFPSPEEFRDIRHIAAKDISAYVSPVGGTAKRVFDITISATSILLMAPIMLVVAALVYLTMGRPILFTQERVGFRLDPFRCFTFRTMVSDADECLQRHLRHCPDAARTWSETRKLKTDPRVTPLGHILRKSSLDELPQLFNILRGDMSCIGPRPVLARELSQRYGPAASDYIRAKPGLTGLWQVNGRSGTSYAHRIKCDRYYVRTWSVLLDLQILLRTIPAVWKFDETD